LEFSIRRNQSREDIEFLCESCFQTAKNTQAIQYTSLKEQYPDKTEHEIFVIFRDEILESFDFSRDDCRVYILESVTGTKVGYIWVAIRDSEDPWDLNRPLWIFDISILPEFRRHGLAKRLLKESEEYAKEIGRNVGLFVHEHNKGAFALYRSVGYHIKSTPLSLKLTTEKRNLTHSTEYNIREAVNNDESSILELSYDTFRRLVRYSTNASDEVITRKFSENNQKIDERGDRLSKFVVINQDDDIIAYLLVGVAYFSDKVSLLYDVSIKTGSNREQLQKLLLDKFIHWSFENGFETAYILLHSEDDISTDVCRDHGFKIPGFFMEKKLT
jgi:GNAT superfamily N-acetyltransferase/L-amino acid N-acyltransferase YncA